MNPKNTVQGTLAVVKSLSAETVGLRTKPSDVHNLYAHIPSSRATENVANRYIVPVMQTQNIFPVTPQIRAERMLKEAEILLHEDASLFHEVVKQLSEKGNSLLGENHPLVRFFSGKRAPDYLKRTDENIAEVRKQSQNTAG